MGRWLAVSGLFLVLVACGGAEPRPVAVPPVASVAPAPVASSAPPPPVPPPAAEPSPAGLEARPIAPRESPEWDTSLKAYEVFRDKAKPQTERDAAAYRLASALDRAGLFVAAFAMYAEIATKKGSPARVDILERFAAVAGDDVARGIDVVERIGEFDVREFDAPKLAVVRGDLLLLKGQYFYRNRNYAEAASMLATVPKTSKAYGKAQVLAGMAHVQLHHGKAAVEAFRAASTEAGASEETKNLAALSLARTVYSAGFERASGGGFHVKSAPRAVALYEQVKAEPFVRDASFELAWAKHYASDDAGALQALARLTKRTDAPPPSSALLFEAYLLWRSCRYDEATASLDALEKTYAPFESAVKEMSRFAESDHDHRVFEMARGAGNPPSGLAPWLPELRSHAALRTVARSTAEATREQAGLRTNAPPSWRSSALGSDVSDALQLSSDIGERNTAGLLRTAVEALAEQVRADKKSVKPLRDAIAAARRGGLSADLQADQLCTKK